jgi:hypothetical protein
MKTKLKPQRRAKIPRQQRPAAEFALTFKVNTIFFDETQNKTVFLEAGRPGPWTRLEDIPPRLQPLVCLPPSGDSIPNDTELQHWTPKPLVDLEDEEFDRLAGGEHPDPEIQAAIDDRNDDYLETTQARNLAYAESSARSDADRDRLAEEIAEENTGLDVRPERIGRMV